MWSVTSSLVKEVSFLRKDGFHDISTILFRVTLSARQFKVTWGGPKTKNTYKQIILAGMLLVYENTYIYACLQYYNISIVVSIMYDTCRYAIKISHLMILTGLLANS